MAGEHIQVWDGELGELRAASTAGGGTALTTTAALVLLPDGTQHAFVTPRNFAGGALVAKIAVNPYLRILKTTDALATVAKLTDYSTAAQQVGSAAGNLVLSALNTLANKHFLLVSSWVPWRGVRFPAPTAANAVVSTLLVEYWNGTSWVSLAVTDGTAAGGATFAQAGDVTWTVPSAWTKAVDSPLIVPTPVGDGVLGTTTPLYHTRWTVSAQLTSPTTFTSMLALNRSTAYYELISGQSFAEAVGKGPFGVASVEALTDQGTANLIVNVASRYRSPFA